MPGAEKQLLQHNNTFVEVQIEDRMITDTGPILNRNWVNARLPGPN